MKIVKGTPPNYERIKEVIDIEGRDVVFTFGDTLYNPRGNDIPPNLLAHEEVHAHQQTDPGAWWERYLIDPQFRLEQELEAYGVQYAYAKEHIKDRNKLQRFLFLIASDLASPLYGNILTHGQAESRIRNAAKVVVKFKDNGDD